MASKTRSAGGKKSYAQMSERELAEATREFDVAPLPNDVGEPLGTAEQAQWQAAKRGRGRPRKGRGAVNVLISLERGLLEEVDAFAKSNEMGRSELIGIGLRMAMSVGAFRQAVAQLGAASSTSLGRLQPDEGSALSMIAAMLQRRGDVLVQVSQGRKPMLQTLETKNVPRSAASESSLLEELSPRLRRKVTPVAKLS